MELLGREYTEGTRDRLKALIEYVLSPEMQKFWAADAVSGVAHYQMALLANKDGDYKLAIQELEHLPKEYPAYIYAQGQCAFIALKARRENNNLTEKEKKELIETVRRAVQRMPPLPNDADSTTAFMYYLAQVELSRILYSDAYQLLASEPLKADQKFKALGKTLDQLMTSFEKLPIKLKGENRDTINLELRVMRKYADLGMAEVQYREGKFDEVMKVTRPTVDAVKKLDNGKDPIRMRDYQVTGDLLGLALRAEVRKGNIAEAKTLLDTVKRLADDGDQKADAGVNKASDRVVQNLLTEIAAQVVDLKNRKADTELKKVVGSFSTFLDTLLKDTDLRKMPMGERLLLAKAFSGLGMHDKAAELYEQVQPPVKLLESKKAIKDFDEAEIRELADYWSAVWEHVKELRAAKNYAAAFKILDGVRGDPKQGHKEVKGWLNHPKALFAMPQGQMEKNFILEDDKKYGAATQGWNAFMKAASNKPNDTKIERAYFDAYFYGTRTLYLYAMNDPGVKSKDKMLDFAAKRIVELEFSKNKKGWEMTSDRFEQLLKSEPMLKNAYDRLKKLRIDAK